jgi:cytidine deaminase
MHAGYRSGPPLFGRLHRYWIGHWICGEHAAIAAMVTAGEYEIAKIVAVWRDPDDALYVLPPCGRCREFIRQIDPANIDAAVVTGRDSSLRLRDLLPLNEWPAPVGASLTIHEE